MKSQLIKTDCAQAELYGHDGVLVFESPTNSVTVRGHVNGEIDLTLTKNERELFSGSSDRLEGALEAARALFNLRANHTVRQMLTQLADNGDATAVLHYLNQ